MLVFHHFGFVEVAEVFVDGFHEVTAEVETAFAGGGSGGDEEEQVREHCPAVVAAFDVWHTG